MSKNIVPGDNSLILNSDGTLLAKSLSVSERAVLTNSTITNLQSYSLTALSNIGIGTSSPPDKLTIYASTTTNTQVFAIRDSLGIEKFMFGLDASGKPGMFIWNSAATTSVYLTTNGYTYFNGGNVGIGIVNPSTILDILGNSTGTFYTKIKNANTGDSTAAYRAYNNSDHFVEYGMGCTGQANPPLVDAGYFYSGYGGIVFAAGTSAALKFLTGGVANSNERMRISAAGGLSLGNGYVGTDAGAGSMIIENNLSVIKSTSSVTLAGTNISGTTLWVSNVTFTNIYIDNVISSSNKNIILGSASALLTSATDGFVYIPTCAGTPTSTPTSYTGRVAMVYDTSNEKLYVFNGGWKGASHS